MSAKSALFKKEVAELRPLLMSRYAEVAVRIDATLDAELLRNAVAGRYTYWDALPTLRILAGKAPMPDGLVLTVPQLQTA
ncbi:hypothetical protein BEN47_16780 [Hymenobacter lapidarius]|uniref:Uncharacterized protein n=1 Tax=Hymenobacter lapidarius TaxID=1908237 RepID=A0A1G1SZT7_9BACT|nr:hypothetical protein [Hymenobacter lapidarius]OGX84132.1 hypothetical protein BEN47_16780 [Hymenobacter lapidarius]